jgi:FAD/FMN-containing dehydrogenase
MSKIAEYLGQNLSGEVTDEPTVRRYFATDGSVLSIMPSVVIYPRTTDDIRKVVRFAWRLAEKGHVLPITPRGYGASNTGAGIGAGAVMVFPAHLTKVLEFDSKLKKVRVQPGMNVRALQEAVATHGLFLPTYPANLKYATVGGILADNVSGPKGCKYGAIRDYTDKLEVVLSNGEVIQTGRVAKRELNAKKGLQTLEGEIYREIDALIEENAETIEKNARTDLPDNTGYRLDLVKASDGSFDLTPLLVGSGGTLAITSQAILNLVPKPVETALMIAALPSLDGFDDLIESLNGYGPSELKFIDSTALKWTEETTKVNTLGDMTKGDPAGVLVIEFDDGDGHRSKSAKRVMKMLDEFGAVVELAETQEDKEDIWAAVGILGAAKNHYSNGLRSVEFADAVVPIGRLAAFHEKLTELIDRRKITGLISGNIGAGNLGVTALLDLNRTGDRQAVFGFARDYYKLVGKLGGSIAGDSSDGRLRIAAAQGQYNDEMLGLYERVKEIFDPKNILNPGVILGTAEDELIPLLVSDVEPRFLDYRPRV